MLNFLKDCVNFTLIETMTKLFQEMVIGSPIKFERSLTENNSQIFLTCFYSRQSINQSSLLLQSLRDMYIYLIMKFGSP